MSDSATILHVDLDAFFASVEVLEAPQLRGKPVAVGGDGRRGVVASCSYEARWYGVRSAMPSMRAKRLCPNLVFVPGQHHLYEHYSRRMHEIFESFTPLVEGISLDEAFLDVAGAVRLFGEPLSIAEAIRTRIRTELGLSASVGIASTKHLAKLASVSAKPKASASGPVEGKGVVCVPEDSAVEFLTPLPVRALWGVGRKTAEKLERLGILTVGQLAKISVEQLQMVLGQANAQHLHDLAWNRDERPVVPSRSAKSVGHEQTYSEDLLRRSEVHLQFVRLADATASRLRSRKSAGRTISVKVRFSDFQTLTRSRTLPRSTATAATLVEVADELTEGLDLAKGIRLLGISVSNLEDAMQVEQLDMESGPRSETQELDEVVDQIRDRYGHESVVPAPLLTSGTLRSSWNGNSARVRRD